MEEVKPVNLPFTPPNLVGTYNTPDTEKTPTVDAYQESINRIQQMTSSQPQAVSQYTGKELGLTSSTAERFPVMYPGRDNEEIYAQSQGTWEKAYNGVVKMAGLATSTFIQGTAGLVYGVYEATNTGKFSSLYSNDLSKRLNEWTDSLEDSNAHYRTQREREGSWWEPSNLFTANFLFDNIVKNIGFSLGAMASGVAWGAGLKAIGLTSKLVGAGEEMAAKAEAAIGEATSLPKAERLGSIVNKLEGLSAKGLMNSDRIITAAMGTVGESGIEALSNSQQFRENMINQFRETHGYNPSIEDMKEIDRYAENVGNWSFALNSALLTATNYIQLPKVFGSTFKGEKQLANNIALQEGKYIATLPTEGFGKFLYKSKNIASLFFEGSEAFEEGAQYAIQTGTQNYYERRYKGKDVSALDDGILKGVREALTTDEGLLNVFTGGFSGGLMTSGISTLGRTGKISERGFTGYGGEQAILRDEAIKSLNSTMLRDKFKDVYGNIKASESIQKDREAAIRRGDILESKDLEFDYAHTFVTSRLKYNAKDAIDNEINNIKLETSTNEGFIKLQQEGIVASTDTRESFIKRLDNLQQHANYASELYKAAEIKYKGKLDEDNKPIYSDEVIDKMVYAGAKVMNYNQRIPEVAYNLSKNGIDTLTIANEISNGKLTEASIKDAVAKIKQLGSIEEDDLLNDLRDFVELSLRKKQFITEYNDIKNSPLKYKEEKSKFEEEIEQPLEQKEYSFINSKKKREVAEVGKEYELPTIKTAYWKKEKDSYNVYTPTGEIEKYDTPEAADKAMNDINKDINALAKVKIVAQNADGTLKIEDLSGVIQDIKPETLQDYSKVVSQEDILLENNKSLQADLLSTHTSRPSTETNNKEVFDPIPKKSLMDVANSTTASTSLVKPHQQRANRFGFNLPKFKKEFKGVVVTAKTEGSILNGLTKYLLFDNPDSDQETFTHTTKTGRKITYNVNNIIALVVTDEKGNLVDENGKKLPEGLSDKEKLDRAIYQVFPEELQAEYFNPETQKWEVQSMFRKDESTEQVASLEKQYNEWRNRTLQRETLPIPQKIDASFGTPEYNMKTTEVMVNGKPVQKTSIDYDNRTSVKEAGLITEGMLKTNLLIDISTTNDEIKEGKVSLKNTLGKVFLRIPNQGLVKLFNRKFNKKEAETIFSVIEQLCKNLYKKYEGKLSDEELSDILSQNKIFTNWLDSVVYWGIPKDKDKGGFNSIWFDGGKLNISGKGTQFDFTPSNLAANRATIITLIEGMYHDSSVRLLKEDNFGNKYKQIIGIKEDGTPEFKEWQNYQTYLLSPEGRTKEEIPLTTILRPIEDSTDVNRKGIYFTLTDSEFELPKEAPATTVQKEIKKEVEQEKKAKEEAVNKVESVILEDVKFPTMSQIDNSENELANREHYKKLKSQYEKLKELFKCI